MKHYGEKTVAAMVLSMAYANFQDRLLLCLGSPIEPGGPLPPLDVIFAGFAPHSAPSRASGDACIETDVVGDPRPQART